jgi:hypothetical protein
MKQVELHCAVMDQKSFAEAFSSSCALLGAQEIQQSLC